MPGKKQYYNFLMFPPYIDAYNKSNQPTELQKIKGMMQVMGGEWGEVAVGRGLLHHGTPTKYNADRPVLVCCQLHNKNHVFVKTLLLVFKDYNHSTGKTETEFVYGDLCPAWDVT